MTAHRFAIRAFVGYNGDGKSLAVVDRMVLPAWAEGRPVLSNMTLYPERAGYSSDLYVPLDSWLQLVDVPEGWAIVLDEVTSVLPSRQSMSVPPQLQRVTKQMRKGGHIVGWTDTNWSRADVMLREVTQGVTVCRGSVADPWERDEDGRVARDQDGRRVRYGGAWPQYRLFRWTTFNAKLFDEFTYSQAKDLKPLSRQWYWRPRNLAHRCYKTREQVSLMDWLDETGTCPRCGGQRTRPKCKCPPTQPSAVPPQGAADERDGTGPAVGALPTVRDPHGPIVSRRREPKVRP